MPTAKLIQTAFTSGELSPRLEGRVDVQKYFSGVKTLLNFLVFAHGGITRRSGTHYVAETKFSELGQDRKVRLIPFEFNVEQAYILELGHLYCRFHTLNGRLEFPIGAPVEITTTYTEDEIFDIQYAQSADVLYLAHPDHRPRKITRQDSNTFVINDVMFSTVNPIEGVNIITNGTFGNGLTNWDDISTGSSFIVLNTTPNRANFQVGSGSAILEQAVATTIGEIYTIRADVINFPILFRAGTSSGDTSLANTLQGVGTARQATFTATGTVTYISFKAQQGGAWLDNVQVVVIDDNPANFVTGQPDSNPRAVTFFENRLLWGGTNQNPQTIWGSVTGDFENMDQGTAEEDESFEFTLGTNQVNLIRWLVAHTALTIGTTGGEFLMSGGTNEPIVPANVYVRSQTNYGTANVTPIRISNVILYVQRGGRKLREFVYNSDADRYIGNDLTILSEHLTKNAQIVDMTYQQEPDSILWCVMSDGTFLSLTLQRDQEVIAWARHSTQGQVESMATIPHPNSINDQTWAVVKRNINGNDVKYIEYFDNITDNFTAREWLNLNTDSAITYKGVPITVMTGLDHLEGETVQIIVDGAIHPDRTVTGGSVTLNFEGTEIEVGLPYTSEIVTLRPELQGQGTTIQGAKKVWSEVFVHVVDSLGIEIENQQVPFRKSGDPLDEAVPLFSGNIRVSNRGIDDEGRITVRQTQPLPLTILSIFGRLNYGDR